MAQQARPRLPLAPLLPLLPEGEPGHADQNRGDPHRLALAAGVSLRTATRYCSEGELPDDAADRAACHIGLHAALIWGAEWWRLAPTDAELTEIEARRKVAHRERKARERRARAARTTREEQTA